MLQCLLCVRDASLFFVISRGPLQGARRACPFVRQRTTQRALSMRQVVKRARSSKNVEGRAETARNDGRQYFALEFHHREARFGRFTVPYLKLSTICFDCACMNCGAGYGRCIVGLVFTFSNTLCGNVFDASSGGDIDSSASATPCPRRYYSCLPFIVLCIAARLRQLLIYGLSQTRPTLQTRPPK